MKQRNHVALYLQHDCKWIWEKRRENSSPAAANASRCGSAEPTRLSFPKRKDCDSSRIDCCDGEILQLSSRVEASACLAPSLGDTVASHLPAPPPRLPPPHASLGAAAAHSTRVLILRSQTVAETRLPQSGPAQPYRHLLVCQDDFQYFFLLGWSCQQCAGMVGSELGNRTAVCYSGNNADL